MFHRKKDLRIGALVSFFVFSIFVRFNKCAVFYRVYMLHLSVTSAGHLLYIFMFSNGWKYIRNFKLPALFLN